jgi:hypothetical protein
VLSRLGGVGCDVGDVQASCAGFEEHQGIVAVAECSVDVEKSAAEDAVALRGPRSTGPWPSFTVAPARTLWHRKAGGNKLVHHPLCTEPSRLRRGTTPVRPDPRHPGPHQRSRGGTPLAPLQ